VALRLEPVKEVAGGAELDHLRVLCVGHVDVAGRAESHAKGRVEKAPRPDDRLEGALRVVDLDLVAGVVGHRHRGGAGADRDPDRSVAADGDRAHERAVGIEHVPLVALGGGGIESARHVHREPTRAHRGDDERHRGV
jgi:hypothetical protein